MMFVLAGAWVGFFCAAGWATQYGVSVGLVAGLFGMAGGGAGGLVFPVLLDSLWRKIGPQRYSLRSSLVIVEVALLLALAVAALRGFAVCVHAWLR